MKYDRASHFTVYPVEYEERIIPLGEPINYLTTASKKSDNSVQTGVSFKP